MSSVTNTYTNDFNQLMESFANFRDAYDPKKQRIHFSPKGEISLTAKSKGFKRLCEFFYKPSHLRLSKVIERTIVFLENSQPLLIDAKNLQRLIRFRVKVISISSSSKKIESKTLKRLDSLVETVRQKLKEQEQLVLDTANREAETILQAAASVQKEKEKTVEDLQTSTNGKVLDLQKNIEQQKKVKKEIIESKLNERNNTINKVYSFNFKPADCFQLGNAVIGTPAKDLTFISEHGEKVATHSILFPSLLANATKTGDSYEISLKGYSPGFFSNRIKKFLELYTATNQQTTLSLRWILNCYLMALNLKVTEFANELKKIIDQILDVDVILYFQMLDFLTDNPFSKGHTEILADYLSRIDKFPVETLREVPQHLLENFRDTILASVLDDPLCGKTAKSIYSTLKKVIL